MRKKIYNQPIFQNLSVGGGADVSGVTATASDVDEGKIFVDSSGEEVEGTSTYKADYIALNQSVNTINNNLESVITGSGSGGGLTVDQVKGLIDRTGTSFTIPEGTTSIGTYAFYNHAHLVGIDIPNTVTSIGNYAFSRTGITSITIPNSVIIFGDYIFQSSQNLQTVILPDTLTTVPNSCFQDCNKITSIDIPNTVTSISNLAFSGCRLTSINLPSGLTNIGNGVFGNNTTMTSITFPSALETLGSEVFSYCYGLKTVTFLGTPTSIHNNAFRYSSLTTIYVPWSEGEVAGSPWGAVNATVVYGHTA